MKLKQKDIFALYSLPYSTDYYLIRQFSEKVNNFKEKSLEQSGFVFHPFIESETTPSIFIQKDEFYKNPIIEFFSNHIGDAKGITKSIYLKQVNKFIKATNLNYQKIILSRVEVIKSKTDNLFKLFIAMKESYESAFVYLINIPNVGCWMGASPEIFINEKDSYFETVALAGTQVDLGLDLNNVLWENKEIEEHAIVEQYIERKLNKENVTFDKTSPYTIKAGNSLHLKTKFRFSPPTNLFNFMKNLHPTPAVCGFPKKLAKSFIVNNEEHNRDYYTGFLGPVNIENEINLFVNLRCMQVFKDKFVMYIGGGITPDSEPEKEWNETKLKSKTLSDVIERIYKIKPIE